VALWVTLRHVPESRDIEAGRRPDYAGALTVTLGLAGVVFALIEGPANGFSPGVIAAGVLGALGLIAFPFVEHRSDSPLVPLDIFKSRQFSGANATTFVVYAGLGVALFLVVLELQTVLGYSALAAGAATLPITVMMLLLSPRAGRLSQRIGPRLPMTIGPLVVAAGLFLLAGIAPDSSYLSGIFPGLVVFSLGLAITVAPLTTAVMGAVDERHVGVGSGVNNAVAASRDSLRSRSCRRSPGSRRPAKDRRSPTEWRAPSISPPVSPWPAPSSPGSRSGTERRS
jgi:predicted MFS family arabinose efflux permease